MNDEVAIFDDVGPIDLANAFWQGHPLDRGPWIIKGADSFKLVLDDGEGLEDLLLLLAEDNVRALGMGTSLSALEFLKVLGIKLRPQVLLEEASVYLCRPATRSFMGELGRVCTRGSLH